MAVKIDRLWSDKTFSSLDNFTKLFFLYLATNPNITKVGVLCLNMDLVKVHLKCDIKAIRKATKELIREDLLHVKQVDKTVYFIVPQHFESLPKSETILRGILKDLKNLPNELVEYLKGIGIDTSSKDTIFIKPTEEEVLEYGMSQGYIVDAQAFIDFYNEKGKIHGKPQAWIDGNGKHVRDWKAKLRKVWFRNAKRLKKSKGAPEGFEYFYVKVKGEYYAPDGWKDGKPYSKSFLIDKEMKKKYKLL